MTKGWDIMYWKECVAKMVSKGLWAGCHKRKLHDYQETEWERITWNLFYDDFIHQNWFVHGAIKTKKIGKKGHYMFFRNSKLSISFSVNSMKIVWKERERELLQEEDLWSYSIEGFDSDWKYCKILLSNEERRWRWREWYIEKGIKFLSDERKLLEGEHTIMRLVVDSKKGEK